MRALTVLPDGQLASGARDSMIRLWDVASGAETARMEGHSGWVYALAVLPDGRLTSGSDDKTIRLWDVATKQEIARLEVDAAVHSICVLSDTYLAAGDSLGRIHWLEIVDEQPSSTPYDHHASNRDVNSAQPQMSPAAIRVVQ